MAGKYDIDIYQGASLSFSFTLESDTPSGTPEPVDLTLANVYMQIRQNYQSNELMLDLNAGGHIWIDEPLAGRIKIDIPGSVTRNLYIRTTGVYDILVVFDDGNILKPLAGIVNFHPEVTQIQN